MRSFVTGFLIQFGISTMLVAGLICILAASELAAPQGKIISREARIRAIAFSLLYLASLSLSAALAGRVLASYRPPALIHGSIIVAAFSAALIGDFFYYWYHRAQHSIPWLWRIHSVHHSAEELGAGSGFHHLAEGPLKAVLVGVPTGLIVSRPGIGFVAALLTMQAVYIHSSTRLNFGRIAWIVSDNRVHRIHHSLEAEHFDKNFGAFTLLWDRLFGTAYLPRRDEWPGVGLAGQEEPRAVLGLLALPTSGSPRLSSHARPANAVRRPSE